MGRYILVQPTEMGTIIKAGPEYSGQIKLKWSFPFDNIPTKIIPKFGSNGKRHKSLITLVNSLSPVEILNPVKFDLNYCFRHLLGPTSISAINNAEGK